MTRVRAPEASGVVQGRTETPAEHRLRMRAACLQGWANTEDRVARSKPGRDAAFARFENEVDPEHKLAPDERRKRAEYARRSHMLSLSLKAAKARRRAAGTQEGRRP